MTSIDIKDLKNMKLKRCKVQIGTGGGALVSGPYLTVEVAGAEPVAVIEAASRAYREIWPHKEPVPATSIGSRTVAEYKR